MTTQPPEVDYQCLDCHKLFKVRQGSRRRYCDDCQGKRAVDGLKKAIASRHKKNK